MKKVFALALVLVFFFSISYAQLGIKGGINIATYGGDGSKQTVSVTDPSLSSLPPVTMEPKIKIGFVGGISYNIGLLFGLSIQPEVLYIQKGAIYETGTISLSPVYPGASFSGKSTMSVDYIMIPVVIKYSILPLPLVKPYFVGGVSYDILVSAKSKIESTYNGVPGAIQNQTKEVDMKDNMNKSDLSLQLGIGVEALMVEVDARYIFGFTTLDKADQTKIYTRGIVITAGVRL
jgi:hypothetical protein